jgi:hypothetical protein
MINYSELGLEVIGFSEYSDFSTHKPETPSGVLKQLRTEAGEVLVETLILNTLEMNRKAFFRATTIQFGAEVQQYLVQLEREQVR